MHLKEPLLLRRMMVIDICVTPPDPDVLAGFLTPPAHLARYFEVYAAQFTASPQLSHLTAADFIGMMDAAQVDVAVIHGEDQETTFKKKIPNETVARLVERYPTRFIGFAGVDPHKPTAVEQLDHDIRELGLRGAMLSPWEHLLYSNDDKYLPIYERCVELDIPVWIHTSSNLSPQIAMDFGHPLFLDKVAVKFPRLKIIAGHAGWPWVTEAVAVAWRHPNVYLDISGIRQKYIGMPNTGWGPLLHYGNSVIQDKVLFGTAWPLLPLEQAVRDVQELPLKEVVKAKWLGENAKRLLRL